MQNERSNMEDVALTDSGYVRSLSSPGASPLLFLFHRGQPVCSHDSDRLPSSNLDSVAWRQTTARRSHQLSLASSFTPS
jgi:hypothetical protein